MNVISLDSNSHPAMMFQVTGWQRSDKQLNEPDTVETQMYTKGSIWEHVPPPPCKYNIIWPSGYAPMQEKLQLSCTTCYPHKAEPEDQVKTNDQLPPAH